VLEPEVEAQLAWAAAQGYWEVLGVVMGYLGLLHYRLPGAQRGSHGIVSKWFETVLCRWMLKHSALSGTALSLIGLYHSNLT